MLRESEHDSNHRTRVLTAVRARRNASGGSSAFADDDTLLGVGAIIRDLTAGSRAAKYPPQPVDHDGAGSHNPFNHYCRLAGGSASARRRAWPRWGLHSHRLGDGRLRLYGRWFVPVREPNDPTRK